MDACWMEWPSSTMEWPSFRSMILSAFSSLLARSLKAFLPGLPSRERLWLTSAVKRCFTNFQMRYNCNQKIRKYLKDFTRRPEKPKFIQSEIPSIGSPFHVKSSQSEVSSICSPVQFNGGSDRSRLSIPHCMSDYKFCQLALPLPGTRLLAFQTHRNSIWIL